MVLSRATRSRTKLLPPAMAIQMTRSRTGAFHENDDYFNEAAAATERLLVEIRDAASSDERENAYVSGALAAMDASMHTLDTIYRLRAVQWKENDALRGTYLESIKEYENFGKQAKDYLKALPTMTVGTGGGVTLAQLAGLSGVALIGIGAASAGAGFFVNWLVARHANNRKLRNLVTTEYERSMYYEQYLDRYADTIRALYAEIDGQHERVFGQKYEPGADVGAMIDSLLAGTASQPCKFVHRHMMEGKITPELWVLCESGVLEGLVTCAHYWEEEE